MIIEYKGYKPEIHSGCFVAENTTIIGQVTLKKNSSVWHGTVKCEMIIIFP